MSTMMNYLASSFRGIADDYADDEEDDVVYEEYEGSESSTEYTDISDQEISEDDDDDGEDDELDDELDDDDGENDKLVEDEQIIDEAYEGEFGDEYEEEGEYAEDVIQNEYNYTNEVAIEEDKIQQETNDVEGIPSDVQDENARAIVPVNNETAIESVESLAENDKIVPLEPKEDTNGVGKFRNVASLMASSSKAKVIGLLGQDESVDDDDDDEDEDIDNSDEMDMTLFGAHDFLSLNHLYPNQIRTLCSMENIPTIGNKKTLLLKLQRKVKADLPVMWTRWMSGRDSQNSVATTRNHEDDQESDVLVGPRRTDGAACVFNGMIYYYGGSYKGHAMNTMIRRDPDTCVWYLVQPINRQLNKEHKGEKSREIVAREMSAYNGPSPRTHHSIVVYKNRLWLYGGYGDNTNPLSDMHVYDFKDNFWVKEEYFDEKIESDDGIVQNIAAVFKGKKKLCPPPKRYFHVSLVYKNKMIVYGGIDEKHRFNTDVHVYHFDEARWEKLETVGTKPRPTGICDATIFKKHLFSLSFSQKSGMAEMMKLDLKTNTWSFIDIETHRDRNVDFHLTYRNAYATCRHNKFWMLHGGKTKTGNYLDDTYAYDFYSNKWTKVEAEGYVGTARAHHSIVSVDGDNRAAAELFVVAGKSSSNKGGEKGSGVFTALKDEYFTMSPLPPPDTQITTNSSLISMLKQFCGAFSYGYEPVPLSDCIVVCKDNEMPAHRIVLAAQSPVFADLFKPGNIEYETGQVEIEGFDLDVVQSLLSFMYGVSEKLAFGPHCIQLFQLASEVKIAELRATAEQVLVSGVQPSNAATMMHLAEEYNSKYIRDACLSVTAEGMQDVVKSEAYRNLIHARPDLVQTYTTSALDKLKREQQNLLEQRKALEKLIMEEKSLMTDKKAILSLSENPNSFAATKWKDVSSRRAELMQKAATSIKSSSVDRAKFAKNVFVSMQADSREKLAKDMATSPVIRLASMKRKEDTAKARASIRKSKQTPVVSYDPKTR